MLYIKKMLSKKENDRAILETLDQVPRHSCCKKCCKKMLLKKENNRAILETLDEVRRIHAMLVLARAKISDL